MKYKYILFDLDGTITESAPGIRHSLEATLKDLGLQGVDLSDYTRYIGPPLLDTLRNLCHVPEELCDRGYELYKEHYNNEGRFENKPYDGIESVLKQLKNLDVKLAVCSSKLEQTAIQVMKDVGLDGYFDKICGSNRECTRKDKKDLIPYAVAQLGGTADDTDKTVMIGDTWYDAEGAMQCKVDFIACSYGYGTKQSIEKYNPVFWAESPEDILKALK